MAFIRWAAIAVLSTCSAFAASISVGSVGSWSNPQGTAANVNISNGDPLSTVAWGTSSGYGQSAWGYYGHSSTVDMADFESGFLIGAFFHLNRPIYNYDFTGATLGLTVTIDGNVFNLDPLDFTHYESPNGGTCDPAPAPGYPKCPDVVSIPSVAKMGQVTIDGMLYDVKILGFGGSIDTSTTQFITQEKKFNKTKLWASLTKSQDQPNGEIPEPTSMLLLGGGLLALAALKKRASRP